MIFLSSSVSRPRIVELDFLVERAGEVAHRARERVEDGRDRQHRQLDDVLAQLFGDEVEAHAVVAEVDQELAHAARHRVERVGVLGELLSRDRSRRTRASSRASRTRSRSWLSTRSSRRSSVCRSNALRLCTTISGARCASRSSFSIGHAQRLPQLGRLALRTGQTTLGSSLSWESDPVTRSLVPGSDPVSTAASLAQMSPTSTALHLAAGELVDARGHQVDRAEHDVEDVAIEQRRSLAWPRRTDLRAGVRSARCR